MPSHENALWVCTGMRIASVNSDHKVSTDLQKCSFMNLSLKPTIDLSLG